MPCASCAPPGRATSRRHPPPRQEVAGQNTTPFASGNELSPDILVASPSRDLSMILRRLCATCECGRSHFGPSATKQAPDFVAHRPRPPMYPRALQVGRGQAMRWPTRGWSSCGRLVVAATIATEVALTPFGCASHPPLPRSGAADHQRGPRRRRRHKRAAGAADASGVAPM